MNFLPTFYETKDEISSNLSKIFCFYDDSVIEIRNSSYTKAISADTTFNIPIEVIVKKKNFIL